MRAVVQRIASGGVTADGSFTGGVGRGMLILVGVGHGDTVADARYLADKCTRLRIFEDAAGKMNLSLADIGGAALVVSQFTLYADTSSRRPGFSAAAPPETAVPCYEAFLARMRENGVSVAAGRFGADMRIAVENDGPVTILLESKTEKTNPATQQQAARQ